MHIKNPILWADFPDPDLIRVGNAYYMVTTTMFFMPAAPIMKSYDLVHWSIVSYITDKIEGYDQVGSGYGRGQWATSLRMRGNRFYAFFTCIDRNKSYLFSTDDIESSNWDRIVFDGVYHDASILFDERDAYLVYNVGDVRLAQFKPDMSGLIEGSDRPLFSTPAEGMALRCEGCRGLYKDGWFYLFFIDIPKGGIRREWCYRARDIDGPYESRVIADSRCDYQNIGVAQGMVIDSPAGDWYMILFGDCGSVGRIPFLFPVSWEEGWPVIGAGQGMKLEYDLPLQAQEETPILFSDNFNHEENKLGLFWQWNHNPDDGRWSFTENPGSLTLHAAPADTILTARNTLTQRVCGPACRFTVFLDAEGLMPGDQAGIAALQWDYAVFHVEIADDGSASLTVFKRMVARTELDGPVERVFSIPLKGRKIWLGAAFDFVDAHDTVKFSYSENGADWKQAGDKLGIGYNLRYFVGTRIALHCYGNGGGVARFSGFTAEVSE